MTAAPSASSNFSQAELDKFGALAQRWWDPQGPQKALHAMNPVRLDYVAARVGLRDARVLDVGCGGGLLSEALAGEGAHVTAIDLAPELVKVARLHGLESGVSVDYRQQPVEALADEAPGSFDAVTCMEMLEHVPDPAAIIQACAQLLKPGGHAIFSTINRNFKAWLFAIIGGEYILRILPRGTHDYAKLIRPDELRSWAGQAGLKHLRSASLMYHPLFKRFRVAAGKEDVNYMMSCVKEA